MNRYKVYWFVLWPVYYHVPIYRAITRRSLFDLKVIYFDEAGIKPYFEREMGVLRDHNEFDLLCGYQYKFLKNWMKHNNDKGFFQLINPSLIGEILRNKPDVVIVQGYVTISDWLAFLTANLGQSKVIFRGEAVLRGNENSKNKKQRIKNFILPKLLKRSDAVMYSCSGNRTYWKFYGVDESKMFPIPCAVDNDYYRSERKKYVGKEKIIKQEIGIREDDYVVVFAARFTNRKRPLDLIKSLERIDNKNIAVLFVGDGPERANMERAAKDFGLKTVFVGFKNQADISKYYAVGDLGVIISDYDPSPKAMNEAMNFELPIIVTDVVGTATDLVKEGINGYIIKVGDIETLAKRIDFLNRNRDISKKMGHRSFELVNEWTFESDAQGIESAIRYVMEKKLVQPQH